MLTTAQLQALVTSEPCVFPCIPDGMKPAVLIVIFAGIAGVSTNPQSLMSADAICAYQCIPPGMQRSVLISLLNQIFDPNPPPSNLPGTPSLEFDSVHFPNWVFNAIQGSPAAPGLATYEWNFQSSIDQVTWVDISNTLIIDPVSDQVFSPMGNGPYFRVRWYDTVLNTYSSPSNIVTYP